MKVCNEFQDMLKGRKENEFGYYIEDYYEDLRAEREMGED